MGIGHRESIDLATSARKRRFNRNTRLHSFRYYAGTRSVWTVAPRDLPRLTLAVNLVRGLYTPLPNISPYLLVFIPRTRYSRVIQPGACEGFQVSIGKKELSDILVAV